MTVSIDRLVRTQLIFREVNERIREVAEHFDSQLRGIDFVCERSREDCGENIDLELDEYKAIRSSPNLFVIVPGHETLRSISLLKRTTAMRWSRRSASSSW
jgi:hypothetical protein